MATIIGIAGSVRRASYNAALLRAAIELAPANLQIEVASIRGVPLYDGDVEEREGVPPAVAELKERIAVADGLLMVSPEYNNSVPGVFKNAIDWMTRPSRDIPRVFGGKPVGLIGASACDLSSGGRSSWRTPARCSIRKADSSTRRCGS
jgi:NAD(P)H-dependent FMN reductase